MSEFMNTIDLLGDEETAKAIVGRTITEFNDNICESIGPNAFNGCSALTSVDLPNATSIGNSAFGGCTALTSVDLPNATTIGPNAFNGCSALTSVDLPNATTISNSAFSKCTKLTSAVFPKITELKNTVLADCTALKNVDVSSVTSIDTYVFNNSSQFATLILRSQTACTLKNTNAFNNTPFAAGKTGGTVYVPQSLISQYQTATNWSTLYAAGTCNFVAIEGSEYE